MGSQPEHTALRYHLELTLTHQGVLILRNATKGNVLWSSANSTTLQVRNPIGQLLDTGNFIIYEEGDRINQEDPIWQSFDSLQHTLLPGEKLGWNLDTGKERHLTAWKSEDDPAFSEFSYLIDARGYPQPMITKGQEIQYRAGSGSGCLLWFGNLTDIRMLPGNGDTIYIRLSASELGIPGNEPGRDHENRSDDENLELPLFGLSAILKATNNFSINNKLGEGGFGPVYKAWGLHNEGGSLQLVAKCLGESINVSQVLRSIHIALLCVQRHLEDRPTMTTVVLMLGSESPLPSPKEPGDHMDNIETKPESSISQGGR
ncbi:hypothetical protein L1987_85037 [Smallanthus sonchifolius]|uniref:Uncharacterized protein n=1 Tax=Smallanthus sonchifolius TaxID=185202 RepID=A0ACB8XVB4_9ASTR|nr:hypothetical protein L1987_85037 [Smallanthus sonchifolius]